MKRLTLAVLLSVVVSSCASMHAPQGASAACDRACLKGQIDQYLAALVAHDPSRLRLAPGVRFTEDSKQMPLGSGFWKTATKLRSYRQDMLDVRASTAGALVVVEEGDHPALLVLRVKIAPNGISEIETMVVHNQQEGLILEAASLQSASAAMTWVPPEAQRESRENAVRIATGYVDGLKAGSFTKAGTQFAPGTYRVENGRRMAGPGCTFMPPACENIETQAIPPIAATSRVAVVDEELGIVWLRLDFAESIVGPAGTGLHVWEAFKVYGGQIHAVEAFLKLMPTNTPSGWE